MPSTRNHAHATGANNGKTCIQLALSTGNHACGAKYGKLETGAKCRKTCNWCQKRQKNRVNQSMIAFGFGASE